MVNTPFWRCRTWDLAWDLCQLKLVNHIFYSDAILYDCTPNMVVYEAKLVFCMRTKVDQNAASLYLTRFFNSA